VIWHESSLIGLVIRPLNRKDNTARQMETNMSQSCLQRTQTHVNVVNITSSTCLFYFLNTINTNPNSLITNHLFKFLRSSNNTLQQSYILYTEKPSKPLSYALYDILWTNLSLFYIIWYDMYPGIDKITQPYCTFDFKDLYIRYS